jgi:hypothetical protein
VSLITASGIQTKSQKKKKRKHRYKKMAISFNPGRYYPYVIPPLANLLGSREAINKIQLEEYYLLLFMEYQAPAMYKIMYRVDQEIPETLWAASQSLFRKTQMCYMWDWIRLLEQYLNPLLYFDLVSNGDETQEVQDLKRQISQKRAQIRRQENVIRGSNRELQDVKLTPEDERKKQQAIQDATRRIQGYDTKVAAFGEEWKQIRERTLNPVLSDLSNLEAVLFLLQFKHLYQSKLTLHNLFLPVTKAQHVALRYIPVQAQTWVTNEPSGALAFSPESMITNSTRETTLSESEAVYKQLDEKGFRYGLQKGQRYPATNFNSYLVYPLWSVGEAARILCRKTHCLTQM